jgi:asparagine synthetase B (glutamine-hydrolysing)
MIHRPLPTADIQTLYAPGPVPPGYLRTVDALYGRSDESASDIDRMQEVMLATFLSENILTFADAVAMDSSAELRMPFLDRDLVAFVLGLPDRQRVSRLPGRANTKLILRRWAKGRLPADVTTRRKRSFPFGNLPELLETEGDTIRGRILECPAVSAHLRGLEGWLGREPGYFRGPWEGTLWALLALGIWCEHAGVRAD